AGGPVDVVLDVAGEVHVADAADAQLTGVDVQPAAVARFVDGLRVDDVRAQAVVDGQLRAGAPRVLHVVELPPLALPRVRVRAHVPPQAGHVAEQEGGDADAAAARSGRA